MNKSELIRAYQDRLKQHGPSAEAVQYTDQTSQFARFSILAEIDPHLTSVLDVGCGLADFWMFLRRRGNMVRYCGVEIVPEFVEIANKAMEDDPNAQAHLMDAEAADLPGGYDYAVLSGVFNNCMDDNWSFMTSTLRRMWSAAEKGVAFNAMSTHVDYRDPSLWYVDPADVLAFCKTELGGHPILRHDYITRPGGFPFEFAVYVRRDPVLPSDIMP